MIKAIIWDVDGTLISTKRLYPEAYRRALAPYVGREMTNEEMFKVPSRSELRFLRMHAGKDYDAALADFRRHYAELHATHYGGVYPGVLETIAELRQRGMLLGIVTGKSRSSFEVVADELGQFDVLVMDDDVESPKPHPEGIFAALKALDVRAAQAIYVGDSVTDLAAANEAETIPAAALWSKEGADLDAFVERAREEPNVLYLHQPHELLDHIGQFAKGTTEQ